MVSPVLLPEVDGEQLVVRPPPLLAGGLQQRLGAGVEATLAERLEDDAVRGHDGLRVAVKPVERKGEVPHEPALQVRVDEAAVRDKVRRDAVAAHVVDEAGEGGAAPPTRGPHAGSHARERPRAGPRRGRAGPAARRIRKGGEGRGGASGGVGWGRRRLGMWRWCA